VSAVLVRGRVSRSVALRLAAGVLPSVLAVGLLIGLFYYGQFGRAIPALILILASALTIASIVMAWLNARYFAERLARLARTAAHAADDGPPSDEFDQIERAVGSLGSALSASEAERKRLGTIAEARLHQQATMLAGAVSDSIAQLDQVRLPLQILLESPFGALNENQEELLHDARAAADAIDVALRRLAQVAEIDRGVLSVQHEPVEVNDVVRSVLPLARATAERNGARTETSLEPGLPRVTGDRTRLAEALALLVTAAAVRSRDDKPLMVSTARDGSRTIIRIAPGDGAASDAATVASAGESLQGAGTGTGSTEEATLVLASRLIEVQGGEVHAGAEAFEVRVG
jgi:signal transduction histidine kinase